MEKKRTERLLNDCGRHVFFMEIAFIVVTTIILDHSNQGSVKPTENSIAMFHVLRTRLAPFLIKTIAHLLFMAAQPHTYRLTNEQHEC